MILATVDVERTGGTGGGFPVGSQSHGQKKKNGVLHDDKSPPVLSTLALDANLLTRHYALRNCSNLQRLIQ